MQSARLHFVRKRIVLLAGRMAALSARRRTLAKLGPAFREQAIEALIRESELMLLVKEEEIHDFMDIYLPMIQDI